MNSKIKSILISVVVVIILVMVYIFFIKKTPEIPLTSSSNTTTEDSTKKINTTNNKTQQISKDFISVLLSVKSIKLNDDIFSEPAFLSLKDSSITITPTGDEGRSNPFAPIGTDMVAIPINTNVNIEMPPQISEDIISTPSSPLVPDMNKGSKKN